MGGLEIAPVATCLLKFCKAIGSGVPAQGDSECFMLMDTRAMVPYELVGSMSACFTLPCRSSMHPIKIFMILCLGFQASFFSMKQGQERNAIAIGAKGGGALLRAAHRRPGGWGPAKGHLQRGPTEATSTSLGQPQWIPGPGPLLNTGLWTWGRT